MSLKRYLSESQLAATQPVTGDSFNISVNGISNIKSTVTEHATGSITISLDQKAMKALTEAGIEFDDEEEVEYMPAEGDVVQIDHPSDHDGQLGQVVEVAPSGNFAYVEFKDGSVESYHSSDLVKVNDEAAYAYFDDEGEEDDGFDESLGSITRLAGMSKVSEAPQYDQSADGPYDRGAADAYYGRKGRPHKIIDKPNASVKGERMMVPLTDPKEIDAYYAGYNSAEFGEKDYGSFPDLGDDDMDESMNDIRKLAGLKKEGIENWNVGISSIPRTEPFKLKQIVVKSKFGKTYTFDTEEEAKRHFGKNWETMIKNPEWRKANGWKLDMNNTKPEIPVGEAFSDWNAHDVTSAHIQPYQQKAVVVTSPKGKVYSFDSEEEARKVFLDKWHIVKNPNSGWMVDMANTKISETSLKMLDKMKNNDLSAYRRGAKAEHKAEMEKLRKEKEEREKKTDESMSVYVKESATGKLSKLILPNTDFKKNNNSWSYKVWTKK